MTFKQKRFIKKYIETGNGTQAALEAYDTTDPNVAHSIAVGNLRSPTVRVEIEEALESTGLDLVSTSKLLKKATTAGLGQKATNADSLRGIEMMLKLQNAFPAQKSAHLRLDVTQERRRELEKMSYKELKESYEKRQKEIEELLAEDEWEPESQKSLSPGGPKTNGSL